jgi:hypothetical protein
MGELEIDESHVDIVDNIDVRHIIGMHPEFLPTNTPESFLRK